MKMTLLVVIALFFVSSQVQARAHKLHVNEKKLVHGISQKENPKRNKWLVGDKHMHNKAIGPLQIRLTCLADVNRLVGKKTMRRLWGKSRLTMKDMVDFKKAEWVCLTYLSHWGKVYTQETGRTPTIEIYARMYNGGPTGWKKWNTRGYGKAVAHYAQKYKVRRG